MDKLTSDLEELYQTIKDDIDNLKEFGEIDLSSRYEELKQISRYVIHNRSLLLDSEWDMARYALLGFAIEIAKKPSSLKSFWDEVFSELGIIREQQQRAYTIIFKEVWRTLKDIGINVEISDANRRLLVGTLRLIVKSDPELLNNATKFFEEYYKKHRTEGIENAFRAYEKYEEYKDQKDEFIIIALNLTKVADYVIENCLHRLENEEEVRAEIIDRLGIDPLKYTRRRLSTIIRDVLNRVTPVQFKKILQEHRYDDVILPDGSQQICGNLLGKILDYGRYIIGEEEYRVTPNLRIGLEDMKKWEYETIKVFESIAYYKKKELFSVLGETVRRFVDKGEEFYVWCGTISIGEECEIDGIRIKGKEGLFWNPRLYLVWGNGETPPSLQIEIGKVVCFYPEYSGRKLKVGLEEQVKEYWFDLNGFFSDRYIEFDLDGNLLKLILSISVGDQILEEKIFTLDDHMLFSGSTREQIKSYSETSKVTKRRFGESKYYLFSTAKQEELDFREDIGDKKHIEVSVIGEFGRYNVYEVIWASTENFSLKVEEYGWQFERKKFLEWWFKDNNNVFCSVKDMEIKVYTNINVERTEENLFLKILSSDYTPITEDFEVEDFVIAGETILINGETILENALEQDLPPGEYRLDLHLGDLICSRIFYIIPKIEIKWPALLKDNEKSLVRVSAGEHLLRKPGSTNGVKTADFEVYGKVLGFYKNPLKVEPENISIKIGFTKPFISREYTPEETIYVFGYRLYLKSKDTDEFTPVEELNYYDINRAVLLVFTKPRELVELIINEDCILCEKADDNGDCLFGNLAELAKYCTSPEITVQIKSTVSLQLEASKLGRHFVSGCEVQESEIKKVFNENLNLSGLDYEIRSIEPFYYDQNVSLKLGVTKSLKILWHPRVYSVECPDAWLGGDIVAKVDIEGAPGSKVMLELKTQSKVLDKATLSCSGKKEIREERFQVSEDIEDAFLYLVSYFLSLDGELLQSKTLTLHNAMKTKVEVSIGDRTVSELLARFLDEFVRFASLFLSQLEPVYVKIPVKSIRKEFVELLAAINSNIEIIIPYTYQQAYYETSDITACNNRLHVLKDEENREVRNLDNILNPVKFEDIVSLGICISSKEILNNKNSFLPKPNPVVVCEAQELQEEEKRAILDYCSNRNLIFISNEGAHET